VSLTAADEFANYTHRRQHVSTLLSTNNEAKAESRENARPRLL